MQQQMTTNVQAVGGEMVDDSSEEDYMLKSIFEQELENVATLSEKNVKKIKGVRKKLKQNKNEEKMGKKSKKKLKNIEVTQQQMITDVKAAGTEMIHDSNKEDYILKSIFKQEPENVATLSKKNIKEIKYVRKKLKQNRNEEKMEKKSKKKLKNIEVTQQQMTTDVKATGAEMIHDSNEEYYMLKSIFKQEPENFATLSEKNVKEIKYVRKKLKQNKNEEEMKKKSKKKLKNIEVTQQQMTTDVKATGAEMIHDSNEEDYMLKSIFKQEPENFATLSKKNVKEVKDVSEKFEQSAEQIDKYSLIKLLTDSIEKMNKVLNNETKVIKLLEDIETNDESIIIRKQIRGEDKVTDAKTENKRDDTIFIKKLIFLLSLCPNITKYQKIIKNITDKAYQPPDDYHSMEYAYKKFIDVCTSQQRDKNQLGVSDANTHIRNRIKRTYCNIADDILKLKYYKMNVNNNCQTAVNSKSKEHGYTLNEIVEEDQVMKVVEENEIKEVENTDPNTTSNETLLYGKDVILENNGKMTNETLMEEDIPNVAHKIDKQIDVRKNWWTIHIENMFSRLIFLFLLLLLFLLFCNYE